MLDSSNCLFPPKCSSVFLQCISEEFWIFVPPLLTARQHIGRIEKGELVSVAYVTIQAIAEALQMTCDIIDPALADLAPLKRLM